MFGLSSTAIYDGGGREERMLHLTHLEVQLLKHSFSNKQSLCPQIKKKKSNNIKKIK